MSWLSLLSLISTIVSLVYVMAKSSFIISSDGAVVTALERSIERDPFNGRFQVGSKMIVCNNTKQTNKKNQFKISTWFDCGEDLRKLRIHLKPRSLSRLDRELMVPTTVT
uniref:Uncharacterized protein n=1 Tax=Cacopsylla melanoneura TaxID=428564 RepID=A0A8D8TPZ5_9HEMI